MLGLVVSTIKKDISKTVLYCSSSYFQQIFCCIDWTFFISFIGYRYDTRILTVQQGIEWNYKISFTGCRQNTHILTVQQRIELIYKIDRFRIHNRKVNKPLIIVARYITTYHVVICMTKFMKDSPIKF